MILAPLFSSLLFYENSRLASVGSAVFPAIEEGENWTLAFRLWLAVWFAAPFCSLFGSLDTGFSVLLRSRILAWSFAGLAVLFSADT